MFIALLLAAAPPEGAVSRGWDILIDRLKDFPFEMAKKDRERYLDEQKAYQECLFARGAEMAAIAADGAFRHVRTCKQPVP